MGFLNVTLTKLVQACKEAVTGISKSVSEAVKPRPPPVLDPEPEQNDSKQVPDSPILNESVNEEKDSRTLKDSCSNNDSSAPNYSRYRNDSSAAKESSAPNYSKYRNDSNGAKDTSTPNYSRYRNDSSATKDTSAPNYSRYRNDSSATKDSRSQNNSNAENDSRYQNYSSAENHSRTKKESDHQRKFGNQNGARAQKESDQDHHSKYESNYNSDSSDTLRTRPKNLKYYEMLDLPESASMVEIRQAYRRLALKWHPDKNLCNQREAEKRFREITEAYQILSDPVKRVEYDQLGDNAFNTASGLNHTFQSPMEVFQEMFGMNSKVLQDVLGDEGSFFEPFACTKEHYKSTRKARNATNRPRQESNFEDLKNAWSENVRPSFPIKDQRCKPTHMALTATKFLDGTTVITKTTVENGCEIIENFEDGKIISRQVDGIAQVLTPCC